MSFKLVEYKILRAKILQCIHNLAKKRGGYPDAQMFIDSYLEDKVNLDELTKRYAKLNPERRTQMGILLTVIRCLDKLSDEKQQTLLLNAIACYQCDDILKSYNPQDSWLNYAASFFTDENSSFLYGSLFHALDFSQNNFLTGIETFKLFSALEDFLLENIYQDQNKSILSVENPFNQNKIEGFDWQEYTHALNGRIGQLKYEIPIGRRLEVFAEKKQATVSSSGLGVFKSVPSSSEQTCKAAADEDNLGISYPTAISSSV